MFVSQEFLSSFFFCKFLSESSTSVKELIMVAGGNQSILMWMEKEVKKDLQKFFF